MIETIKLWLWGAPPPAPTPAPPTAPMFFVALENFYSLDLRSNYVTGLFYTIKPENTVLAALAQRWAAEGKIAFRSERPTARTMGIGKVK